MCRAIAAFAILSQVANVASTAYDSQSHTWNPAEVAKELTVPSGKKAPDADKDYKDATFNFGAKETKVKATTPAPSGFLYKLEVTDIAFELYGNLPDDVKNKLKTGNSGSNRTPGSGTVLSGCSKYMGKQTFDDFGMEGTLKLVISRATGDQAKAECGCSNAKVANAVSAVWKTQCKLDETNITKHACAAMISVCNDLLDANHQK